MILCCGESLIDMIPTAAEGGQTGFVPHSGGAVFNTAIGLGRLGVPVGMLSGVSTDQFGAQLVAALHASRVDTSNLVRSDRLTTLAMVHLVDGKATYTFYDENSAGRMVEIADLPDNFRHEMLSVQLVELAADRLPSEGILRELVLHLVASHHGHGRPFAPVCIDDSPPEVASLPEVGIDADFTAEQRRDCISPHRLDSGVAASPNPELRRLVCPCPPGHALLPQ